MIDADLIYLFDMIGVAVFAITGALAAQGKKLDILGVVVLGIVTALGGGTIRDITLDVHPLIWIADTTYLWTAIISAVAAFFYLPLPDLSPASDAFAGCTGDVFICGIGRTESNCIGYARGYRGHDGDADRLCRGYDP